MSNRLKFVISIAIPHVVSILSTLITIPAIGGWYQTIAKPWWTPPNWVFMPVWTTLYTFMGIALFLVWQDGAQKSAIRKGFIAFSIQLALNFLWSFCFFGLKSPGLAFFVIIALWIMIVITMGIFWELKKKISVLLFIPYIIWVTYALALNAQIWFLN